MKGKSAWMSIGVAVSIIAVSGWFNTARAGGGQGGGVPTSKVDLRADLSNPDGVKATVIYRERDQDGVRDRRFILRVSNASPGQLFEFFLEGELHAAVTAGADGTGVLRARTPEFIENPDDWVPMPQTFPRIFFGAGVRVGLLFGTMIDEDLEPPDGMVDLQAQLFGTLGQRGRVTYRERIADGTLDRRLLMRVNDAQPGELVRLYVNGEFTAGATAGSDGVALLRARTSAFIKNSDDWDVLPASFPRLFYGDGVIAGSTSGYMFEDADEGDEIYNVSQRVRVAGVFGVPESLNGVSTYEERKRKSNLERYFVVEVRDAVPGQTLAVRINTFQVGVVHVDSTGRGELRLRTEQYIDEPSPERPIPDDFPTILAEWVITVGVQSGPYIRIE